MCSEAVALTPFQVSALIVASPGATPLTTPLPLTVAAALSLLHVTLVSTTLLDASRTVTGKVSNVLTGMFAAAGAMVTDAGAGHGCAANVALLLRGLGAPTSKSTVGSNVVAQPAFLRRAAVVFDNVGVVLPQADPLPNGTRATTAVRHA